LHCADMPFAEVPAVVAGLTEDFGDGDLLGTDGPARRECTHAIGVTSGEKARSCGRAGRMRSIEAVKAEAGASHPVKHGSFHMRMAVVTGLLPSVVIAHHEHDVR